MVVSYFPTRSLKNTHLTEPRTLVGTTGNTYKVPSSEFSCEGCILGRLAEVFGKHVLDKQRPIHYQESPAVRKPCDRILILGIRKYVLQL